MNYSADRPVEDIHLEGSTGIDGLVRQMEASGGFNAKHVGEAVDILERMVRDPECVVFLSFPACIIATGARGLIRDLVKSGSADVLITTAGMLDHDLARSWEDYYHGTFAADDAELREQGINRLGNVFVPNESYGIILEKKMQPVLAELYEQGGGRWSTRQLCSEFGKRVGSEESILHWAAQKDVPVFVPGPTDGAFGCQVWMFYQDHRDVCFDLLADEQELSDIVYGAKKTGALMIGGGISKHHTIWWNQFRDGLDYAIQISTAPESDGSLSGARVKEAVSWGKVRADARYITVEGDATVVLPLMVGALLERLR